MLMLNGPAPPIDPAPTGVIVTCDDVECIFEFCIYKFGPINEQAGNPSWYRQEQGPKEI